MGLVLFDADLRYVLVNDTLADFNGVPSAAHTGRPLEEVVPELAPILRPVLERALAGESAVNVEIDQRTAGRPGGRTTLETFYPLPDAEGNVVGVGGVIVDISARRELEVARDEAHGLLDTLFDNAPVGLGFWDSDLRFRRVNAAMAEMTGLAPEAHVGRTVDELLPGLSADFAETLRRVMENGGVVLGDEVSGETPAAPGIRRYWSLSCYPVRDRSGRIVGAGAVCDEITDLRHARDSERYLRELLDEERSVLREVVGRAPAGIALLWGHEDRIRLANERFREIALLDEDPTGRPFAEILPDLWPIAGPLLAGVRESGRALSREDFSIPARDPALEGAYQGRRYLTFSLDPVGAPDAETSGILIVVLDTTQQVRRRVELEDELAEERQITAALQRALLPRRLPDVPGAALAARYEAAGERFAVGGDFYDAVELRGGTWMVVVGDVCGKGPEAAALTAMTRYTLRAEAMHADGPGALLQMLSDEMLRREADATAAGEVARFATVACAWIQPADDGLELRLACAGQPDPLLLRGDGSFDRVRPGGPPCGVFPRSEYPETRTLLRRGEALVLYTDGVLDAGAPRRQLEIDELGEELAGTADGEAERVASAVAAIVAERGGEHPRDDYAVLVVAAR